MASKLNVRPADKYTPAKVQVEELSRNREGGRIIYKSIEKATNKAFVIKEFRFADSSDWSVLELHERHLLQAGHKVAHPCLGQSASHLWFHDASMHSVVPFVGGAGRWCN
jgi:hypothetical protein